MVTVLLAAGESSRMGKPKLLLPYHGKPLVLHALDAALDASERVFVVTGWYREEVQFLLEPYYARYNDRVLTIINTNPQAGQFSSTQIGVAKVKEGESFAIALADAPLVTRIHYDELARHLDGFDAVRPYCNTTPGHPVLCAPRLRSVILSLPTNSTMRSLLSGRNVCKLEGNDSAWITDIDTPQAYERLVSLG